MTLREFVKSNPFFYKLWFNLYRKNKGLKPIFFRPDTRVFIDGYQRSGNTFAIFLIKIFFPDIHLVHHLHAVAPIKIAALKGIPIFILIRNPGDSISSNYLKHFSQMGRNIPKAIDSKLLKQMTKEWVEYYGFCLASDSIKDFIFFKDLIKFPENFIYKIASKLNLKLKQTEVLKLIQEKSPKYIGATDPLGSSTPSVFKEELKNNIKEQLLTITEFKNASSIYKLIKLKFNVVDDHVRLENT